MNSKKLRGKIVEEFTTLNAFAKKFGISSSSLTYKLKKMNFTTREILKACSLLKLDRQDILNYFY